MANWTICEHSVNRFLNCSRLVVGWSATRLQPHYKMKVDRSLKPTTNLLSGLILQLLLRPTWKMAASNDNFAIF